MAEAETARRASRHQQLFQDIEDPICIVRDMAKLCLVAMDHAGKQYVGGPESDYVKVTKDNWSLLSFALHQQEEKANALAAVFYDESHE